MALGNATAPGTTVRTQPFGPASPNAAGYRDQPAMYASGNSAAYWLPYKGWDHFDHYHNGLDEAGPFGTPLVAVETGKVIHAGLRYVNTVNGLVPNGGGLVLGLEIRPGTVFWYNHCSALLAVPVGKIIAKGQPVARIGSTGVATGNHCHESLEIREYDQFGNPRTIMWNPLLFMAGGPFANDIRVRSVYATNPARNDIVKFNATVDGVNLRTAPDSSRNNVAAVAYNDKPPSPNGIIRLRDGRKIGNTSSQRKLWSTVAGKDGLIYNELRIAGSDLPRLYVQARFMHRV